MSKSPTAKLRARAEFAEEAAVGMGFLLLKLRSRYGDDFGVGISEQVNQAIRDYRKIEQQRMQRMSTPTTKEQGS